MEKPEIYKMLEMMVASIHGFNLQPDRAVGIWHHSMSKYTKEEAWAAINSIVGGSDVRLTPSLIAGHCASTRHKNRQYEANTERSRWQDAADRSFVGVPGKNRKEQVIYVQAQRAAEHWIAGETDNDYFNSKLLDAMAIGFVFDSVDYSMVNVSPDYVGICNIAQ